MALVGCVKRKGKELEENNGAILKRRGNNIVDDSTMGDSEEIMRKEMCDKVVTFLVMSGIPLKAVKSAGFQKMWESVARFGPGFVPPSIEDLRGKHLKYEVARIKEAVEDHKIRWKRTGCSILVDSWNDGYGMSIFNFFVNSPKGTVFLKSVNASKVCNNADGIFELIDGVVNEVGLENVVQVVTKNEESFKAAGRLLMEKRESIFWMPCAVHCIELMFEEFEKRMKVHQDAIANGRRITSYIYSRASVIDLLHYFTKGKDLIRPAVTRGATSYLTLDLLSRRKDALRKMFTSKSWKSSAFSRSASGKQVEDIVMDSEFWKDIEICLKGANPLIKVLRLVYSDEKPAMGFIYKEMKQAKEKIQNNFNSVKRRYLRLWDIIDEKWEKEFHRPLEAVAYYLNPQFHYSPDFKNDFDVTYGLYASLAKMMPKGCNVDLHLEEFKNARSFFGSEFAKSAIKTKKPAEWWDSYGSEFPELQNFAVRILSLTCSAYGCTTNWDAFDKVHSKKRSRRRQKTWNDVLFVMSNSKLVDEKKESKAFAYGMEDIASDDEWYVENIESSSNNEEPELYDAELIIPTDEDTPRDPYGYIDDFTIPDIDTDSDNDDGFVGNDDYEDGERFATDDDSMENDGDDKEDDCDDN